MTRFARTLAVNTLILSLLAAIAATANAQSAEPMKAATFTATTITSDYVQSVVGTDEGVPHIRADFHPTWTATDPRASGMATYGVDRLEHPGVFVHAGTFALENDGGSWVGTFWGFQDAATAAHFYIQAEGQGGYEGWTLLADDVCVCDNPTSEVSGVIVPGDLPPAE